MLEMTVGYKRSRSNVACANEPCCWLSVVADKQGFQTLVKAYREISYLLFYLGAHVDIVK
jgi:hypothetical protein